VVNGPGKGGAIFRQVWIRKTTEREPLMMRRKAREVIETRHEALPWDKARKGPVYGPGGDRRIGGVSLIQAFVWNMGTWRPDAKGETQREAPIRVRVPKRDAGTDQLVVAEKPGNAGGAKGLDRLASGVGQPGVRSPSTHALTGERGGVHV